MTAECGLSPMRRDEWYVLYFLFRCDIEKLKTQENIFCAIAERQSIQSNIMKQDDPLAYKLSQKSKHLNLRYGHSLTRH